MNLPDVDPDRTYSTTEAEVIAEQLPPGIELVQHARKGGGWRLELVQDAAKPGLSGPKELAAGRSTPSAAYRC